MIDRPVISKPRDPLTFDLEGVPRDNRLRRAMREELKGAMADEKVFDLNNPPRTQYKHQEFPKLLYKGGEVLTVNDEREQKSAERKGFSETPSPAHDYSRLRNGRAPKHAPVEEPAMDESFAEPEVPE